MLFLDKFLKRASRRIKKRPFRGGFWLRRFRLPPREVRGALVDLDDARQAIGIGGKLVPADGLDAREPQRISAGVTGTLLDLVAGDLQDDLWLDNPHSAKLFERGVGEVLGELKNLSIGYAAVGL